MTKAVWNDRYYVMPIEIVEVAEGRGLVYVYSGHVTGQESIDTIKEMARYPEKLKRLYFTVVDLTHAESLNISHAEIQMIVEADKMVNAHLQPGFVIAIAAVREVQFGLARMWQMYVESVGWQTAVFRDLGETEAWVQEKVLLNFGAQIPSFMAGAENTK